MKSYIKSASQPAAIVKYTQISKRLNLNASKRMRVSAKKQRTSLKYLVWDFWFDFDLVFSIFNFDHKEFFLLRQFVGCCGQTVERINEQKNWQI